MREPEPTAIDAALIEEWALAYLGRYATSADHLRLVLRRRGLRREGDSDGREEILAQADTLIEALIVRYRATGMLDDTAYAAARARRDLARGRSVRRIAAGLAGKGVAREDAASAIAL